MTRGAGSISVTDAGGNIESYVLDGFGDRVTTYNKAGGATAYYYDHLGRLVWDWVYAPVYRPDGSVQATGSHRNVYGYDSRGNVTAKIEAYCETERRNTQLCLRQGQPADPGLP